MPTVHDIIKSFLGLNGFDGLCHPPDCGCGVDDLQPCGEDMGECRAAYRCEHPKCEHELEPMYCTTRPSECEHMMEADDATD